MNRRQHKKRVKRRLWWHVCKAANTPGDILADPASYDVTVSLLNEDDSVLVSKTVVLHRVRR